VKDEDASRAEKELIADTGSTYGGQAHRSLRLTLGRVRPPLSSPQVRVRGGDESIITGPYEVVASDRRRTPAAADTDATELDFCGALGVATSRQLSAAHGSLGQSNGKAAVTDMRRKRRGTMSTCTLRERLLAGGVLSGLVYAALTVAVAAQQGASPPDFSSNQVGWVTIGGDLTPVPGGPKPVSFDPAHPYVPNNIGKQPTFRIADLANPNLKPWVVERMKKDNAEVLAGKIAYTPRSSCRPAGTPSFMLIGGAQPMFSNAQAGLDDLFGQSRGAARLS
jgi:hypothetical protein